MVTVLAPTFKVCAPRPKPRSSARAAATSSLSTTLISTSASRSNARHAAARRPINTAARPTGRGGGVLVTDRRRDLESSGSAATLGFRGAILVEAGLFDEGSELCPGSERSWFIRSGALAPLDLRQQAAELGAGLETCLIRRPDDHLDAALAGGDLAGARRGKRGVTDMDTIIEPLLEAMITRGVIICLVPGLYFQQGDKITLPASEMKRLRRLGILEDVRSPLLP